MKAFLKKRIFLGLAANVIVVLSLGWISYKRIENYKDINQSENNLEKITLHTEKIKSIINMVENNSKGYAMTGNEKYLEAYNRNVFSAEREFEYLRNLFESNDRLKRKTSELETLINTKIEYNNRIIELRKLGERENKNLISATEDIENTKAVNQFITDIQKQENIFFKKEKNKKELFSLNLRRAFNGLFILVILLLIVVYYIIRHHLKETKTAEMLLEKNRQLLQSIIDNTTNPIFIKQINGQYLLVNRQFEYLFHHTNEQVKGKTDHQIFSKEIADNLRSSDIDVIKAEREIQIEEKFPHNNELHTYLTVKFPIRDQDNKIYAVGSIATDIDNRKKLDSKIKKSEEQISAIFNAAPEAIIVINEEGNIVKWNPKAETLFGWKANEVIEKPMHEVIMPPRYRDLHLKGLKHFLKTGEGPILNKTIELPALNRKNDEFDIEITISFINQEGKYLFIAFLRDITERKLLHKKVEDSEKFLNLIIENIPSIIFIKDSKDLRYILINKAAEIQFDYKKEEVIGKNVYDLFPMERADFVAKQDRDVLTKGELLDISEEKVALKSGNYRLHTKKIPIKDENGKSVYLLEISENITEQKILEEKEKETEKLLEQNLQQINLILENIGEGVIVVDKYGEIILTNKMAGEIIGIKEDDIIYTPVDWAKDFDLFYPDEDTIFPAQYLPLEKALLRGESTDNLEIIIQDRVSKESKRIMVNGRPIRDEKNNIVAAVTTIKDITKLTELEESLKASETKYRTLIGFKLQESKTKDDKKNS